MTESTVVREVISGKLGMPPFSISSRIPHDLGILKFVKSLPSLKITK